MLQRKKERKRDGVREENLVQPKLPHNCPARSPTCPGCETHTALPGPNHTAEV